MKTYTIVIDEDQRETIQKALAALSPPDTELLFLFTELPTMEKEDPHVIHGLCY